MNRYHRQTLVLGKAAQEQLEKATVAVVGVGALGTVSAELLARSGINLILVDRDSVEETNLQRQLLFTEDDVGKSKALVAKEKLTKINSQINIEVHATHLSKDNIQILDKAGLILDCTDNLATRFLLNDLCKKTSTPWTYSAAIKQAGYVMPIFPNGPCLRCFLKETSVETCDTVGVLNTTTTLVATIATNLVIKILAKQQVESILYQINCATLQIQRLKIKQNPTCPTCNQTYEYLEKEDNAQVVQFCKNGKFQIQGKPKDLQQVKQVWLKVGQVIDDRQTLRFENILLFKDGRALIKAESKEQAKALYSKWVGN